MPSPPEEQWPERRGPGRQSDHDLLIEIKIRLERLELRVNELVRNDQLLVELKIRTEDLEGRLGKVLGNGSPLFLPYKEFLAKFEPVKLVVYGLVSLILVGVGGAILSFVFRRGAP